MRLSVGVGDYGFGNFRSVLSMLSRLEVEAESITDPEDIFRKRLVILPGVGAFDSAMAELHSKGWSEAFRQYAQNSQNRLVGICLGSQLLGLSSEEGNASGLGLLPIVSRKIATPDKPIPRMSWGQVDYDRNSDFSSVLPLQGRYYFSHSYYFDVPEHLVLGTTKYGSFTYPCVVGQSNVLGFQFHPEKSHRDGLELLKKVVKWSTTFLG